MGSQLRNRPCEWSVFFIGGHFFGKFLQKQKASQIHSCTDIIVNLTHHRFTAIKKNGISLLLFYLVSGRTVS